MNEQIAAALRDMFRVGEIVSTDPESVTARVQFRDTDDVVSAPLQVLQRYTVENKSYEMPDVGEIVACLFLGNGSISSAGYILGKLYNKNDVPPETGQDISYMKFKDDTTFKYDREEHKATVEIKGDVEIDIEGTRIEKISESQELTVPILKINGESFQLNSSDSVEIIGGDVTINGGDIKITGGDIVVSGSEVTISGSGDSLVV